ncbi:fatty acyl-AMP ligase [Streptomyces sp. NPDC046887]|uniref:fatty acyl-AMP ligase n=1 Tax=Streptomyces sp. NPDC046887 TaxID=3155472 RepID=UPI0033F5FDC5
MSTFTACLRRQADRYGDTRWFAHTTGRRGIPAETGRLTYRELHHRAERLGAALTGAGATDQAVLLLYPAGLEFLAAFLGCLHARAVAVPAPLPATDPGALRRAERIVHDAGVRLVLTDRAHERSLRHWLRTTGLEEKVECLATDAAELPGPLPEPSRPAVTAETVAYLQYTSGSTSEPRGVLVSHANLMHNSAQINALISRPGEATEGTGVGWLPHYHDMGLVGQLLQPLYASGNMVIAAPSAFVARPVLWLRMIDRYRARATMAPDFAYAWLHRCAQDEDLAGLDLSCLEWALNGAEPVRPDTLRALTRRLRPYGLRPDVWAPAYGMAEATLLVTGTRRGAGARITAFDTGHLEHHRAVAPAGARRTEIVSSGRPTGTEVLIVRPDGTDPLPDGTVGEIWLAGPGVAQGYWNSPTATEQTFGARTTDGAGPYLRTGDLGFLLGGELYVTGRAKEVIVVHGRNLYPQDIEEAGRTAHPAAGTAAAFGVEADGEHVVLVQEIGPEQLNGTSPGELADRIRRSARRAVGAPVSVLLVPRNTVPRTTSGKIRRAPLRTAFLSGRLPLLHIDAHPRVTALAGGGPGRPPRAQDTPPTQKGTPP